MDCELVSNPKPTSSETKQQNAFVQLRERYYPRLQLAYLVVLIRGYRDEGRLMKDVSTVGGVLGSKGVVFVCFDYVKSWLVLVHRVQDDLKRVREGRAFYFDFVITFMKSHIWSLVNKH